MNLLLKCFLCYGLHRILVEGDGRQGYKDKAPYDAIHVGAAAPETPQELINQLKPGGRMIVPVGPAGDTQYLEQVILTVFNMI